MKLSSRTCALMACGVLITILSSARSAKAQQAATSFDQLSSVVKPGDFVIVTDARGNITKGRLGQLSVSSLEVLEKMSRNASGRTVLDRRQLLDRDVKEIRVERPDSLANGILIGAAPGLGLVFCDVIGGCRYNEYGSEHLIGNVGLVLAAVGGAIGGLMDWYHVEEMTVYRAPGARSSPFRISPLLSKSRTGVQLSVGF